MGGAKNAVWNAASSIEIEGQFVDRRTSGGGGGRENKIFIGFVLFPPPTFPLPYSFSIEKKKKKSTGRIVFFDGGNRG